MKQNVVKRRLREGKPSAGTWLNFPSPFVAELVAQAGFDWLVIDMEHNAITVETAALMISSMFPSKTVPMIRIPWNTRENIKRVLDIGAWGIVVPMVNTREQAEQIVSEANYYPAGRRSIGGRRHSIGFATQAGEYFQKANDEIVIVVQIEHIEAVNRIDDILSVPGIDACFIGPNDLMSSMGLPPRLESDHPDVVQAIETVRQAAARHGVASGIHVGSEETANRRIAEGFQFIAVGSDLNYLMTRALEVVEKLDASALATPWTKREVRY